MKFKLRSTIFIGSVAEKKWRIAAGFPAIGPRIENVDKQETSKQTGTLSRRQALARLGLVAPIAYVAPALLTLVVPGTAEAAGPPSRPVRPPRDR